MIDNFTDWEANNDKLITEGDKFMNKLTPEQKRIIREVYSDFTHFMSGPVDVDGENAIAARSFKCESAHLQQVLKDLRAQDFALYMIFNGIVISGSPSSMTIRGAQISSRQ